MRRSRTSFIFVLAAVLAIEGTAHAADLALDQQLVLACYKVNADAVVAALRKGADVNARFGAKAYDDPAFRDGWTGSHAHLGAGKWTPLLALAASNEYPDPTADLHDVWKDSARVSAIQKNIPLHEIENRRADTIRILQILLSHRCKTEDEDGYGATALYYATDAEKVEFARVLLKYGANPNTKTGVYIDGPGDITPLHAACRSQEMVQLLIDYRANVLAKDSDGSTPVDWVARDSERTFDIIQTPDGWRVRPRTPADAAKNNGGSRHVKTGK